MKKIEIMEEAFHKNPQCSVGDIVFALRVKWKGQKAGSYSDEAIKFLSDKRKEFNKKRDEHFRRKHFMESLNISIRKFSDVIALRLQEIGLDGSAKGFAEYVGFIVDERASQRGNVSNAFEAIGL